MKKILFTLFIGLSSVVFVSHCDAQKTVEASDIIHLDTPAFKEKVYDFEKHAEWTYVGDKPCIIDFYADWCGPCRKLKPTLEKLAREYKGRIYVYAIDVDHNKILASAFRVQSIPMTLVVPMNGIPLMNTGVLPYSTLKKQIEEALVTVEQKNKK